MKHDPKFMMVEALDGLSGQVRDRNNESLFGFGPGKHATAGMFSELSSRICKDQFGEGAGFRLGDVTEELRRLLEPLKAAAAKGGFRMDRVLERLRGAVHNVKAAVAKQAEEMKGGERGAAI